MWAQKNLKIKDDYRYEKYWLNIMFSLVLKKFSELNIMLFDIPKINSSHHIFFLFYKAYGIVV